jgi:hypothetical protein
VFLVLFYIISDPFKVIYNYNEYYADNKPFGVVLNKDFISVESFLKSRKQNNYDSYILGNSRSMFYSIAEWQKYIGANTHPFHFDANSETLYGIYRKMLLMDSLKSPIKNMLLVLDESVLYQSENSVGHLFVKHYAISGQTPFDFQLMFFKAFITTPKFMRAYMDYKFTGSFKPYMYEDHMLSKILVSYKSSTNEMGFKGLEDSIKNHKEAYYANKDDVFFSRDTQTVYSQPVIKNVQLAQLKAIADILKKNGTSFKIIISPLYDQKKMAQADLSILQQYFGKQNVYDFSGINQYTVDKTNYYENSHYRPHVANDILQQVYHHPVTMLANK